ncbi:MAG TPA: lysylphosphatidylglycerol synthase domain-containing protein [Opitutales bacterium]|nr:lysylphosphatidylglycerol synthase domain-containing protein [Opitutales bacterium]
MKRSLRILGLLLAVLGLLFFATKFWQHADSFLSRSWSFQEIVFMGALVALVPFQFWLAAFAWQRILVLFGHRLALREAVRITYISQLARYVPGNVSHHLGKLVLARSSGVPVAVGTGSILAESLLVLGCGTGIAAALLPELLSDLVLGEWSHWSAELLVAFLVSIVIVLGILIFFRKRFKARWKDMVGMSRFAPKSPLSILSTAVGCYLLNFLFLGALAYWIGLCLMPVEGFSFLLCTGAMALAWTAGFLTPGAPAGIGVREFLALLVLSPILGEANTLLLVASHRVVVSLGDLLTFVIGVLLNRYSRLEPESMQ